MTTLTTIIYILFIDLQLLKYNFGVQKIQILLQLLPSDKFYFFSILYISIYQRCPIIISNKRDYHMKLSLSFLTLLAIVMLICSAQQIVDFTYTEHETRTERYSRPTQTIQISPDRKTIEDYSFPEVCSSVRKLEQLKTDDSSEVTVYDLDSMIQFLKADFIDLLKVSEKIKKKKSNIQELSQMSGRYSNVSVASPKQLEELKQSEVKLNGLNNQIKDKSYQLQTLVKDSIKITGGNQFAILSVNFEIQSLNLKLKYLRDLKQKSSDADAAKIKDEYEEFFKDLKRKFENQNILIDDVKNILEGLGSVEALKARISNIKTKIDLNQLIIAEKKDCVKQREEIKKIQKYDSEIKSHMANLREKKKQGHVNNNKYCEGVVQKLQSRVKNVLLSYDYTFVCAEGLESLQQQTKSLKFQHQLLLKRLAQIQNNKKVDDLKKQFDEYHRGIDKKKQQLSRFAIPKYYHDSDQLEKLIVKTQNELKQCRRRKQDLGTPTASKEVDYTRIQKLVMDIKKLKGIYCQEYQRYDNKAQKIWKLVQKYEAEVQYSSKIKGVYQQQIDQLRALQSNFEQLRTKILSSLKSK